MKLKDMPEGRVKRELLDAEYGEDEDRSGEEWLGLWLEWEGIVGYTATILDAVRTLRLCEKEEE